MYFLQITTTISLTPHALTYHLTLTAPSVKAEVAMREVMLCRPLRLDARDYTSSHWFSSATCFRVQPPRHKKEEHRPPEPSSSWAPGWQPGPTWPVIELCDKLSQTGMLTRVKLLSRRQEKQKNRSCQALSSVQFSSVQSLSRVRLFATPWIAARQVSLSINNSRSLLKLMSTLQFSSVQSLMSTLPKGKILSNKNDCCFKPLSLELVCNTYRKLIHLIVLQAFTSGGVQQSTFPKLLQKKKKKVSQPLIMGVMGGGKNEKVPSFSSLSIRGPWEVYRWVCYPWLMAYYQDGTLI